MGLDFAMARTKHLTWKIKLRSYLDGKETMTLAQATSHRECDLGKWMYAEGLKRYAAVPEMHELEKVHEELHSAVKQIIELKQSGNAPGAEDLFGRIEPISRQIIDLLTTIEQKT